MICASLLQGSFILVPVQSRAFSLVGLPVADKELSAPFLNEKWNIQFLLEAWSHIIIKSWLQWGITKMLLMYIVKYIQPETILHFSQATHEEPCSVYNERLYSVFRQLWSENYGHSVQAVLIYSFIVLILLFYSFFLSWKRCRPLHFFESPSSFG